MGYSPWGPKESDTTEVAEYVAIPPRGLHSDDSVTCQTPTSKYLWEAGFPHMVSGETQTFRP